MQITAPASDARWFETAGASWWQTVAPSPYPSLTAPLAGLPGVQVDQRTTLAQDPRIISRGFGARSAFGSRGIKFLLDGVPLSTPDGQLQLSSLVWPTIDQLEILRGPFAALYGNAAGAVISAKSRTRSEPAIVLRHHQSAESTSSQALLLQPEWSLAWQQYHADGFRAHQQAQRQAAAINWQPTLPDHWQLSAHLTWQSDPQLQDPLSLTPTEWLTAPFQTSALAEQFDTGKSIHQLHGSVSLSHDEQQLALWRQQRHIQQRQSQTGAGALSSGGIIQLERTTTGGNYQYVASGFADFIPQLQLQLEQSREHRQGYINANGAVGALRRDEQTQVQSFGAGSQLRWDWRPRWQVHVGARWNDLRYKVDDNYITAANPDDSGKVHYQGLSSAFGVSYTPGAGQQIQLNVGRGFEAPTLADISYRQDQAGVNLALKPATNEQLELVYRYQQERIRAELSSFWIRSHDEIVVLQSQNGRTVYQNTSSTSRTGLEGAIDWQLSARWQWQASGIWQKLHDQNQQVMAGVAASSLFTRLQYQPTSAWQHALQWQWQAKVRVSDRNNQTAPSFTRLDWQSEWQLSEEWQLTLAVENLLDSRYVSAVFINQLSQRYFEPAAPRQWLAGVVWQFQLH